MRRAAIALLACSLCATAHADIWKWVDQFGETHFVDSNRSIYTWLEAGEVHFSDKPDHPGAQRVELAWHSSGSLSDADKVVVSRDPNAVPGETAEQATERRAAEAYYCSQARDILKTYQSASQLFKTQENGERYFLTAEESAAAIAEAQAGVDEFCH